MVALSNLVAHRGDGGAQGAEPLQQAALGDADRDPGAGLLDRRGAGVPRRAAASLPPGVVTDLNGQSREFRSSTSGLYVTFLLALAFIYLVLAAQFESWIDPFDHHADRAAVDHRRAAGAASSTGQSMNVYSQIGLVTLVGLITKHGILIVEFANQLQVRGGPSSTRWSSSATCGCGRS